MKSLKIILWMWFFMAASLVVVAEDLKTPLSLSLRQALLMAKAQNAQVLAANERVRQALNNITASRAMLLPQLTGTLNGQRQTRDLRSSGLKLSGLSNHVSPFNSFDTRGRLTLDIFDPQAIERLESARAGQQLSQAQALKIREDILALMAAMFLEAQRAQQSVGLIEVNLRQIQHQYNIVEVCYRQGTASFSDLNKAKVDLAQAQYALATAQAHAHQTKLDLASALKIPLEQRIIFVDDDKSWVNKNLQVDASLDVMVAQAQLAQSKANQAQARASFWPQVSASGDYGRNGQSPSASSKTYTIGVSVSVPVWEGGLRQAQLQQAKSKVKEDEILLEDVKNQNQVKIKEAIDNVQQALALLRAKWQQWIYTQTQWRVYASRLKNGSASQQEVEAAESMRALALDERNEAQAVYWTAKIGLAHVMGNIEELFDLR